MESLQKSALGGLVLSFVMTSTTLAAGPMAVTTNFPAPLFAGDPFHDNLQSIGVGMELASPTGVHVSQPAKLTFRLLESRAPREGLEIISLTAGGVTYPIAAQSFSATGTFLGTQIFSGPFTGGVGFNDNNFGPDAPPVSWPDGFRVFIRSNDEGNLTGIGPFIGNFQTLYFSVGDSALFSVSSAVPEPGQWALMILGFGLAGAALRESRTRRPAINRSAR